MRTLLAAVIALHGAIHLIGYFRGSGISSALWLVSFLVFLCAAALVFFRHDAWFIPALGGIVLSQALVFTSWGEAKVGTIANVIVLLPAIVAAAHARFVRTVDAEMRALVERAPRWRGKVVTADELAALPAPVQAWLETAGVVGKPRTRTVRLAQRGELRTARDGAWLPATAEQVFTIDEPAFVWRVDATMMRVLPVAGRDRYEAGAGHMLIKAASLVDIVDAHDAKIAEGALLRFLGEMVWFPTAALAPYVSWEPVDARHARATIRHAGLVVSGVFEFSASGRVVGLRAERWLGGGEAALRTPWFVTCWEWRRFDGVEVPVRGEVGWDLAEGTFVYYRWEITGLEIDVSSPSGTRETDAPAVHAGTLAEGHSPGR